MFAALPPSSSVSRFPVPAVARRMILPTSVEPGERDLVHVGVGDDARAGLARARYDVHDAGRQLGVANHLGEQQRREGRRLGGLEDDRVARRERRRELPRRHQQREVPRDHLAGDAERPRVPIRERVLELVRPPRVVEEVRGGERQVDVARLLDRLAAVHRLEHGELAGALLELARDPVQVLRPLAAGEIAPRLLECASGGRHRELDVLGARLGDLRERLLRRRVDGLEPSPALRLDELAADEQPVPILQVDDLRRLRRVRVLPQRLRLLQGGARAPLDLRHQSMVK